jgi:hypothetical protein
MEKLKISEDLLAFKFAFSVLFVLAAMFTFWDKPLFQISHIFPILFGIPLFICSKIKTVFFDEKYLYYIENKEEIAIPLKNIIKISELLFKINRANVWYILFEDENGIEKKIRFLPVLYTFTKFKILLLEQKYRAEVRESEMKIW